ncbi:MAG: hypothetical protein NTY19_04120 [Planctomycetota bacterium]|nr:hypothetical protein [Planctomycetota bacterium]
MTQQRLPGPGSGLGLAGQQLPARRSTVATVTTVDVVAGTAAPHSDCVKPIKPVGYGTLLAEILRRLAEAFSRLATVVAKHEPLIFRACRDMIAVCVTALGNYLLYRRR